MAIKHVKVVTTADDGTSEVGTDEWNDNHTIEDNTITNDHLTGSIAQSKVTNLTTDLSSKSSIASPTFTGTVVLPNVPAIVTTQLNLKAPLANPTFTGTVVLPNVPAIVTTQLNLKAILGSNSFTGDQIVNNGHKLVLKTGGLNNEIFTRGGSAVGNNSITFTAGGTTLMELNGSNNYLWLKDDTALTFGGTQGLKTEASIMYKTADDSLEFRSPNSVQRMNLTTTGVDIIGTLTVDGTVVGGGTPIWKLMVYG